MCHRFESTCVDSVDDLGSLVKVSNLEFLLDKNKCLLIVSVHLSRDAYFIRRLENLRRRSLMYE